MQLERLSAYLRSYPRLLLYFYIPSCPYCKSMFPKYKEFSKKENLRILKINAEKYGNVARKYSITAVPRLIFIDKYKIISRSSGSDKDDFNDFKKTVRKYLANA